MGRIPFPAFVLTGGQSRRMGRDKSILPLRGETMLTRTLARLDSDRVFVVGKTEPADLPDGVVFLADRTAEQAPAHGLEVALARAGQLGAPWALCLAVDFPLLRRRTLSRLSEAAERAPEACRVVLVRADGYLQTLVACYRPELAQRLAKRRLAGDPSLRGLVESVQHQALDPSELEAEPEELVNVNTPDQVLEIEQQLDLDRAESEGEDHDG